MANPPAETATARAIITLAAKEAGILGVGQTLLAEDVNDCLTYLQRLTDTWQKKRWLVPAQETLVLPCTGAKSYTIGPIGSDLVYDPRPPNISAVYVIQNNTGPTPVSLELDPLFAYEDYARISVKDLQSLPDHFFYDAQWPQANFYPWPIPSSVYTLYLIVRVPLNWPQNNLDQVFSLPPEYLEAIHYNLAMRIASGWKMPISDDTRAMAKGSLNTLRVTNTQVPRMTMPPGLTRGKAFNIYNADGY